MTEQSVLYIKRKRKREREKERKDKDAPNETRTCRVTRPHSLFFSTAGKTKLPSWIFCRGERGRDGTDCVYAGES